MASNPNIEKVNDTNCVQEIVFDDLILSEEDISGESESSSDETEYIKKIDERPVKGKIYSVTFVIECWISFINKFNCDLQDNPLQIQKIIQYTNDH